MKYNTILTSKGTTTIPAEIRRQLGIKPGMQVSFSRDPATGKYILQRSQTIEELRALNQVALRRSKDATKEYRSGDGFSRFSEEKYGKSA